MRPKLNRLFIALLTGAALLSAESMNNSRSIF